YVKLDFADNGVGISDRIKKIIFTRRQKKDDSSRGMGLGIWLVKTIVQAYNGTIKVKNRVKEDHSKGSTFSLAFPIVE
ncbi:MAG: histidine kinase, partial [Candidatus Lokiarchaeota archaeon]|nr:histidine kinase [Candidatus Lokiarchaeota archaeon]MBD3342072.1 histidine kinase [Candidatus Lokiarchaeota archaeon]